MPADVQLLAKRLDVASAKVYQWFITRLKKDETEHQQVRF